MASGGGSSRGRDPPRQGSSDEHPVAASVPAADTSVRTFLFADVRGYTRFTQEHGDEEAGRVASEFVELVRDAILASGGEVIEFRGDEALCVFSSARQALRAAVELQLRFRRPTDKGPAFPLPIGIGVDAGEAVRVEAGYRGGALNTAARLCSLAGPGQILATDTVVSLARRLDGIRFVERRPVRLKGLEKPVRLIEVVPEVELPPLPAVPAKKRSRLPRERLVVGGVLSAAIVAAVVTLAVWRGSGGAGLAGIEANSIAVVDASRGRIESQAKLGAAPSAVATGAGFVWVASAADGTVSRIAPDAGTVQTLTLGGSPGGLAYGAGSIWVTNSEQRALVQINPKTAALVQTIEVGNAPGAVAVGDDAVWVANTVDGTVSRFDLAKGAVTDTIAIGPSPAGLAVGAGAVWVSSESNGTVVRVDTASRTIVQAINVGNEPTAVAAAGAVWVTNRQDGTASRIDPGRNAVSAVLRVGSEPSDVAAGPDAVWVASSDGTITRIDPQSGQITDTLTLGSSPSALALADGKLWATTVTPSAGHRGGVLRVRSVPSACRCADPARWAEGANPTDFAVAPLLYDGLVAYRRVAGVAGSTLVSNLAVRLPTPTSEGRTYTFQLRRGVRYSNGKPVRASDFRSSLERLLAINREQAVYSHPYGAIVGAAQCRVGKRCDLSRGIRVDDDVGTIRIHLTRPNPEFLYKLALPFASLVPSGTTLRAARAVPGTGAYRVKTLGRNEIRLVRNEHFRVWSQQARPNGYPNEIRLDLSGAPEASLRAVERQDADWASLLDASLGAERQRGVLTRYADRLHSDPTPLTFWWFLNTRVPPFDDIRVRRAVNYATDRKTLVDLTGVASETCQILPPSFPGYRPYCPYTRDPNPAGTWTASDMAKARALVAASGTAGMHVGVVGINAPVAADVARYFASLLRKLGYRTSLRILQFKELAQVADSRKQAQIGHAGWQADTLAASNFLQALFSCAAFVPKSPANLNLSQFCDRRLDAKMTEAVALQVSDPVRANEIWAEVDRALVDQAVVVSWGSPRNKVLVSERVGNFQSHPLWGTLFDQLWVK